MGPITSPITSLSMILHILVLVVYHGYFATKALRHFMIIRLGRVKRFVRRGTGRIAVSTRIFADA